MKRSAMVAALDAVTSALEEEGEHGVMAAYSSDEYGGMRQLIMPVLDAAILVEWRSPEFSTDEEWKVKRDAEAARVLRVLRSRRLSPGRLVLAAAVEQVAYMLHVEAGGDFEKVVAKKHVRMARRIVDEDVTYSLTVWET